MDNRGTGYDVLKWRFGIIRNSLDCLWMKFCLYGGLKVEDLNRFYLDGLEIKIKVMID